jgi:hypothetical protein
MKENRTLPAWKRKKYYRFFSLLVVHKTCGSEPARENGMSGNIDVDCYAAFASKLGSYS